MPDGRGPRHPVRIAHLGLGAFHRSHQAWYTQLANEVAPEDPWGIASFTGRSSTAADVLTAQDDRYTLIERGPRFDGGSVIESISAAIDGADAHSWREVVADPGVAVITLTVTEGGYHATSEGDLDLDDAVVVGDLALLALGASAGRAAASAPGRLVDGLRARRASGGGPIAVVSCDNLSANGRVTRRVVLDLASRVDAELAAWIGSTVSFVSTMVDRITPASTDADRAIALELTGFADAAPVVAEPFSEWVLAGEFPAGRPAWHLVGARFVADIEPYEQRKLWLLNGAHSLLAYRGLALGLTTVADAMSHEGCRAAVESLWRETRPVLPFDDDELDAALDALRTRWSNRRIEHRLAQVARDGSHKLVPRIVDPIRRRRAAGLGAGDAQLGALAAWALHLDSPARVDPASDALAASVARLDPASRASAVLGFLAPDLANDATLLDALTAQVTELALLRITPATTGASTP